MKFLPLALLALAGGALAWVALRAPEPTYVPPKPALAASVSIPRALPADVPEGLERVVLHVEGMCCNGCTEKLYKRLVATEGVASAAVRFEDGRAEAFVRAEVDEGLLAAALTFDDYVATRVSTN